MAVEFEIRNDLEKRSLVGIDGLNIRYAVTFHTCSSVLNKNDPSPEVDEPIRFSQSKASSWNAQHTFNPPSSTPPHRALSLYLSTIAVLVYFCVLREENDIDESIAAGYADAYEMAAKFDKTK